MKKRLAVLELAQEKIGFAAGHTTIFSATEREALHGHNYTVALKITAQVKDNGICEFDYRFYKKIMIELCKQLGQRFLMPTKSPYMEFSEDDDYYYFVFNHKKMIFLKEDVVLLPIMNITVEELSKWFIDQLTNDIDTIDKHLIEKLTIKVSSSPGQSGIYYWERNE